MSEGAGETKTAPPGLDPRRNVFRPDLAAKSLYGKVSAPNYAPGFPAQVARAAVGLAQGDLNQTLDVRSRDEICQMADAFREVEIDETSSEPCPDRPEDADSPSEGPSSDRQDRQDE